MLDTLAVLMNGNDKQRAAYQAIHEIHIMEDFQAYNPVVCGTIPLGIDVVDSDLDIIMEVYDFDAFKERILELFQEKKAFRMKEMELRGKRVVKSNFRYAGFEFELFGQAVSVQEQNAFVHMQIEYFLLKKYPDIKLEILHLKQQGVKTEPAFCQVLGIMGKDPYEDLISYGKSLLENHDGKN